MFGRFSPDPRVGPLFGHFSVDVRPARPSRKHAYSDVFASFAFFRFPRILGGKRRQKGPKMEPGAPPGAPKVAPERPETGKRREREERRREEISGKTPRGARRPKTEKKAKKEALGTPTSRSGQYCLNIFWIMPGPRGDPQGARRARMSARPRREHDFRENGVTRKRSENTPGEGKD